MNDTNWTKDENGEWHDENLFMMEGNDGRRIYYADIWVKIADNHFPECPVSIAAVKKLKSTLCVCDKIEEANKSAEECLRCHNLAANCKCGKKAQLV